MQRQKGNQLGKTGVKSCTYIELELLLLADLIIHSQVKAWPFTMKLYIQLQN